MHEFRDMFHEEPPAILEELRIKSHLGHSTPVGRPFMWSGQAPIVVPWSMFALVAVMAVALAKKAAEVAEAELLGDGELYL